MLTLGEVLGACIRASWGAYYPDRLWLPRRAVPVG
jgi:hypothetical protein